MSEDPIYWDIPTPGDFGERRAKPFASAGDVFTTARAAIEYDGVSAANANALLDEIEAQNQKIFEKTNIRLENPFRNGYADEARARARENDFGANIARANSEAGVSRFDGYAKDLNLRAGVEVWKERARAALTNAPGADFDPAQLEDLAKLRANRAVVAAAETYDNSEGFLPWMASFAGGMVGSLRDPINIATLFAGGGTVKSTGFVAKMLENAARQGAVNAGAQALASPQVQAWRAQRGQESGLVPALKDVGLAAGFGAGFGAGHTALGSAFGAAKRGLNRLREPPPAQAGRVAEASMEGLSGEARAIIEADAADRATVAARPADSGEAVAGDAYRAALDRAHDPDAPLPPAVAHGGDVTDMVAQGALRDAKTPIEAADILRQTPQGVDSALASNDPALRAAGWLAALDERAFERVRFGEVSPDVAVEVASRVSSGPEQGSMIAALAKAGVRDADEAARFVTRELETANAVAAQDAIFGLDARIKPRQERPPGVSLTQFVAQAGLRDSATTRAIFGGSNPFIPGYGRLLRKNGGRSLDDALRAATEARYLHDPNFHGSGELSLSPSDFIDALLEDWNGQKLYFPNLQDAAARANEALDLAFQKKRASLISKIKKEISREERAIKMADEFAPAREARLADAETIPFETAANDARATSAASDAASRLREGQSGGGGEVGGGGEPPRDLRGRLREEDRAPGEGQGRRSIDDPAANDPLNKVALERDDGIIELVSLDALDAPERLDFLADVVAACKD